MHIGETPIYLNIPTSTTVQTIESKKVNVRTQKNNNWRITVILTIFASGETLSSLLIFKVMQRKDTERKKIAANRVCIIFFILTRKLKEYWEYKAKMWCWSMIKS